MTTTTEIKKLTHPLLGKVHYQIIDDPARPDAVKLLNGFETDFLQSIRVPFLDQLPGFPRSGKLTINRIAAPSLIAALTSIRTEGLFGHLVTYDGAYVPRTIRGNRGALSEHALGLAVDFNARYNPRGTPAKGPGHLGDLTRIAEVMAEFGWRWGNYFHSPDPMHFEYWGTLEQLVQAGRPGKPA